MFTIENQLLRAVIRAKGAELTSLQHKEHGMEYMWSGDPAYWGKHSPVLFPVVGTLKNNTFFFRDKSWQLPRHGFARDRPFAVEDHTGDTITFLLRDDAGTQAIYPFSFEFRIKYTLVENSLAVAYSVLHTGEGNMYFSLGAHPAFRVPLQPGLAFTDYYLAFDKAETAVRWPISANGLIEAEGIPFLDGSDRLPLDKTLFYRDALVFKNLTSSVLSLRSDKGARGLRVDFPGFPYLGIWSAKDADFVCIEPWCGIADGVGASQQLEEKEGINKLPSCETFTRTWTVTVE